MFLNLKKLNKQVKNLYRILKINKMLENTQQSIRNKKSPLFCVKIISAQQHKCERSDKTY